MIGRPTELSRALPARALLLQQRKSQSALLAYLRAAGISISASTLSRYLCHAQVAGFDKLAVDLLICQFIGSEIACLPITDVSPTTQQSIPETAMLSAHAQQHFKIPKDPFVEDINDPDDVFFSTAQREVTDEMRYAVNQAKFFCVSGESGAGKSTLALHFVDKLERSKAKVVVIAPKVKDKAKLNAEHISEAIIAALSNENAKRSHEARGAQVERLLQNSARAGYKHVLLIEEAHKLHPATLKNLKAFWEVRLGLQKLLCIMLIAQPEIDRVLDEKSNYDCREIIRRCQHERMPPFTQASDVAAYIEHKFKRAGANPQCLGKLVPEAILTRLRLRNARGDISNNCHPQVVNNLLCLALNEAAENSDAQVTAELVGRM